MSEQTRTQTGIAALAAMFAAAKAQNRSAFMPYFPIGYPNYRDSVEALALMAAEGVDGFEVGIPFSDPLADGPTNQVATQIALENGTTTRHALDAVRELRGRGVTQPMLMFTYINPVLAYGVDRFARDVREAGGQGLIIPDLPPDEGEEIAAACAREGLALVYFLAPTSSPERIALVAQKATGFIYVVSLTGVTGARTELPPDLTAFIQRLRSQVKDVPLVLGFGISTPEQARRVGELTDGFIVGSALVRAAKDGIEAVRQLTANLRSAF